LIYFAIGICLILRVENPEVPIGDRGSRAKDKKPENESYVHNTLGEYYFLCLRISLLEGHSEFINAGVNSSLNIKTHFFKDAQHRSVFNENLSGETEKTSPFCQIGEI